MRKLKNLLKFRILIIGMILLAWSCQNNDDSESIIQEDIQYNIETNYVSINDIPSVEFFLIDSTNKNTSARTTELSCGSINLEDILQVVNHQEGINNYSFSFTHSTTNTDQVVFYNYVISNLGGDNYSDFIIQYTPDQAYLNQYSIYNKEDISNFSGTIEIIAYSDFCNTSNNFANRTNGTFGCGDDVDNSTSTAGLDNTGDTSSENNNGSSSNGDNNQSDNTSNSGSGSNTSSGGGTSGCWWYWIGSNGDGSGSQIVIACDGELYMPVTNDHDTNNDYYSSRVNGLDCDDLSFVGINPSPSIKTINNCLGNTLTDAQIDWLGNSDNNHFTASINEYIDQNGCSEENEDILQEMMNLLLTDCGLGDTELCEDTSTTVTLFLEELTNTEAEDFDDFEDGPSCESFNFKNTMTIADWQNAAVKNIRFRVVVLSPQGNYINFNILYSKPILFGVPTNMVTGGDISPGLAAELSAHALSVTMSEVVNTYGNQPVSELQVRLYFEQRLKYNYPIITNGGRVRFNPMSLSVIPTEYQTNFFGTGSCD